MTDSNRKPIFTEDRMSALEAISQAQFIAFAPYVFQASVLLRDSGILREVEQSRQEGITIDAITEKLNLARYPVRVLLEAGLGIKLVYRREGRFMLTKLGHFFLNHPMTRVNTDFMRDVCYKGAADLEDSFKEGKPKGLRHLGDWDTIYQGLSQLPKDASDSWFAFDHFYSDSVFPEALPLVFRHSPKKLLDLGCNTGKWSLLCLEYNPEVHIGLGDLPGQLALCRENIEAAGFADRVSYHPLDILADESELPKGYDIIWMSQFLDCFSDNEIVKILEKCYQALSDEGRVVINETFWDRQRFEASAFSLQMTSLYFTTMANGNSQMYDSEVFAGLIARAGFEIADQHDNVGLSHTLLELKKRK